MRKILIIFLWLSGIFNVFASVNTDIPFGTNLNDVTNSMIWIRQEDNGMTGVYASKDDVLYRYYNGVPMLFALYYFQNNILFSKEIAYRGIDNKIVLTTILTAKYGNPVYVMGPPNNLGYCWRNGPIIIAMSPYNYNLNCGIIMENDKNILHEI